MKRNLKLRKTYAFSPEKVWRALTESEYMAKWIMDNNFIPRPGYRAKFTAPAQKGWEGIVYSDVLEVEENRRITYTWEVNEDKIPTTLVWSLEPQKNGTLVTLEHKGFEGLGGIITSMAFASTWKNILNRKLPTVLKYMEN